MNTAPATLAPVSAYVPCFNNAATIGLAIEGIQKQTVPVQEIFVVDDGSTDDSVKRVEAMGVRVISMGSNQGRGAVRARAMAEAKHEFVLCCDATNQLMPKFLETALAWFAAAEVHGVYGRWVDRHAKTSIDRWRARHLFQQELLQEVRRPSCLSTYGALVRRDAVMAAGNYNAELRHGEDYDLGMRLLKAGDVVFDPALEVEPMVRNTLWQVMERYTRWNRAAIKRYTFINFIESHIVAWKILIPRDMAKRDLLAACLSATVPYFALAFDHISSKNSPDDAPANQSPKN